MLSQGAGQWQIATAPSQPHGPEGGQPIFYTALCCKYFLDIVSLHPNISTKNPSIFPASGEKAAITLKIKLKVIAQLQSSVRILSPFKVG